MNNKEQNILDAAETAFVKNGYHAATTRQIAKTAGVNMAMLTYYFVNKESLFQAVVCRKLKMLENQMADIPLHNRSPADQLNIVVNFNIDLIWQNQTFYRFLIREQLTEVSANQSKIVANFFKSGLMLIRDILKRGIALMKFANVDCELAALSIMGGISNIAFDEQYCRDKQRAKAYFSTVTRGLHITNT